jgi:alpha-galactosidase
MPIKYYNKTNLFHLFNNEISYLFTVLENGQLGQLYFGKRVNDKEDYQYLSERGHRDMQACPIEGNPYFSLEHIRQEYPAYGNGDMRYPAYEIETCDGSRIVNFTYRSHTIFAGKKKLEGLPATYVEDDKEAVTLEITLEDKLINSSIVLSYTIYETRPVITRHVRYHCDHEEGISLETAMSMCLDLPDKEYKMLYLAGAWSRERHVCERNLEYGTQGIYSMRGCSSHQFNPYLVLKRKNTNEQTGEAIGFNFVYSGDFLGQVEVDNFNVVRVLMGIHPNEFKWKLNKGESFTTPEVVMAYSEKGLSGLSLTFHKLFKECLIRGTWKEKERPILINNWEATYFDFNEEKILHLAKAAAETGVELFVLDDGWFGTRNDSNSSLGDWYPNLEKLPDGITGLARKINDLGMKFGLWFEPEMVNENSELFKKHPEWVFGDRRRHLSKARGQYVLDFSKDEVVVYVYQLMKKVLSEAPVAYVKWDLNRAFSEVFSNDRDKEYQGKARHKYILGTYSLYERLRNDFPEVLFESCASGGARFDAGMLYYAPQAWASDNTDAVERIKIQYGSSMVYPLCSIGSHVSAIPNEQVFRKESLSMRANVAYFGTFGYELDLTKLEADEIEVIKKQIQFMKKYRRLIQFGDFYRLRSPFEHDNNTAAWIVVSEDKKEAILAYYRIFQKPESGYDKIELLGLEEDMEYLVHEIRDSALEAEKLTPYKRYGSELVNIGISVSDFSSGIKHIAKEIQGDYLSRIYYIRAER